MKTSKNRCNRKGSSGTRRNHKGGSPIFRISPSNQELQTKFTKEDVDTVISNVIHSGYDLSVPETTRKYLVTIMNKKTPDEIREIDKIEDDNMAGFGFTKTTSNKQMLKRILSEIVELSLNNAISRKKPLKTISKKIVEEILSRKDNEYIKRLVE